MYKSKNKTNLEIINWEGFIDGKIKLTKQG